MIRYLISKYNKENLYILPQIVFWWINRAPYNEKNLPKKSNLICRGPVKISGRATYSGL